MVEDRVMQLIPESYCYTITYPKGDAFGDIYLFIALPYGKIRRFFNLGELRSFGDDSLDRQEDIIRLVLIRLLIQMLKRLKHRKHPKIRLNKVDFGRYRQLGLKLIGMRYPRGLALRFKVLCRDNFQCRYCGRSGSEVVLQVDHIYPKSKGGEDSFSNLITACQECNIGKRDMLLPV